MKCVAGTFKAGVGVDLPLLLTFFRIQLIHNRILAMWERKSAFYLHQQNVTEIQNNIFLYILSFHHSCCSCRLKCVHIKILAFSVSISIHIWLMHFWFKKSLNRGYFMVIIRPSLLRIHNKRGKILVRPWEVNWVEEIRIEIGSVYCAEN
jgi:hypothetical protein